MEKSKRPPNKNFFRYFLDEFILFRRDFYFEVPVQPSKLAAKLGELSYESSGWWRQRRIVAQVNKAEKGWEFDLFAQQPVRFTSKTGANIGRDNYAQIAKANGSFHWEKSYTVFEGKITITSYIYFPVLGLLLLLIIPLLIQFRLDKSFEQQLLLLVLLIGTFVFIWLSMFRDRNHLYKLIQSVIQQAEGEA